MPTLNSAPGNAHGNTIGVVWPVTKKTPIPTSPRPAPKTAITVVTHCPTIDDRLTKRPGTPLNAAITIPRSTSDSLMTQSHHVRTETQARVSTTMSTI